MPLRQLIITRSRIIKFVIWLDDYKKKIKKINDDFKPDNDKFSVVH